MGPPGAPFRLGPGEKFPSCPPHPCGRSWTCTASNDLCSAIAAAIHHLHVSYVDPSCLSAFVVCRLIAQDINSLGGVL